MKKKDFSEFSDEVKLLCYIYNKDDRKFINIKDIDLTKVSGKVLFDYFTSTYPDKDYSSVVSMIPYAVMDFEKACELLEKAVKESKTFVAIYPGFDKTDTSKMEYVGSIPDGALYLML
jgi:hypothetical protein